MIRLATIHWQESLKAKRKKKKIHSIFFLILSKSCVSAKAQSHSTMAASQLARIAMDLNCLYCCSEGCSFPFDQLLVKM